MLKELGRKYFGLFTSIAALLWGLILACFEPSLSIIYSSFATAVIGCYIAFSGGNAAEHFSVKPKIKNNSLEEKTKNDE